MLCFELVSFISTVKTLLCGVEREGYCLSDSRRALERAWLGLGGALSVLVSAGAGLPVPVGRAAVPGAVLARRASMFGRSAFRNVSALLRVAARPLEVIGAVLLESVAVGAAARPCGIAVVDADLVPGALIVVSRAAEAVLGPASGYEPNEPPERVPVRVRW